MVALLGRVPLGEINQRAGADRAPIGRTLATVLAAFFYGLGWLLSKGVRLVLTVVASALWSVGYAARWVAAAVAVGWRDASTPRGGS